MEMYEIRCVRLVAARLQGTELDDKTLTWGASGKSAWGKNVLTGAAAERRTVVMASEMLIIQPQAFLQPERAIDLTPDNKAATASIFVKLHNDMQCVPQREGFSLLNHHAHPMLTEDAAFHKFSEMSNIGAWIDREGKLQWDYVLSAGFKGARSVRNGKLGGAATKAAHIERGGHMINKHGKECITGYHELGAANKAAHIERGGHIINKHGQECITGFHELGALGGAATKAAHIERGGHMINKHGKECITGLRDIGVLGGVASCEIHMAKALDEHHTHICISALCRRGVSVRWENGRVVYAHHCYDPQVSGMEGQKAKQKKELTLQMCKKCHRTANECKGGDDCRATCNTTNHKSCQHLH